MLNSRFLHHNIGLMKLCGRHYHGSTREVISCDAVFSELRHSKSYEFPPLVTPPFDSEHAQYFRCACVVRFLSSVKGAVHRSGSLDSFLVRTTKEE